MVPRIKLCKTNILILVLIIFVPENLFLICDFAKSIKEEGKNVFRSFIRIADLDRPDYSDGKGYIEFQGLERGHLNIFLAL